MSEKQLTLKDVLAARTTRRHFLTTTGAAMALAFTTRLPGSSSTLGHGPFSAYPFTLGIASGDPLPGSVVLWTRLAPNPFAPDGGMLDQKFPVAWKVATDERFANVVREGRAFARPEFAHAVHVDVQGLQPGREYFYQFKAGTELSPVGRTKTAPALGARVDQLAFAFVSCQNYTQGYYTAYQNLARENLDLVVHLGDYIYEGADDADAVRPYALQQEVRTLEQYRNRHANYKIDPDLQRAHALFPFVATCDDHEVADNYADGETDPDTRPEEFLIRRAQAYRAYWEHMPLRQLQLPLGPDLPLFRRFTFGDMVEFNVLDTRQYRSDQPDCAGNPDCPPARDPSRTMLGDGQERWLVAGLDRSQARWNVLANQLPLRASEGVDGDKWDGYAAQRTRILSFLAQRKPSNPIVITGDVHNNQVSDLLADFDDPSSEIVGSEFIGTSISSSGDAQVRTEYGPFAQTPWYKFHNSGQRGYVLCDLTHERWRADYKVVQTVKVPTSPVSTLESFVVEDGRRGVQID